MASSECSMEVCQSFPALQSETYSGVIEETKEFVCALQSNHPLQNEFISLLKHPGRNLLRLSNEEKLVSQSEEGESETSFPELIVHLSPPSPQRLDQLKALIIATEAFRELSSMAAVKHILEFTTEEKNNLFILFKEIPFFSSAHTFSRDALPDYDPLFQQLLGKIGFTQWRGHLMYERLQGSDSGLDKVTLAIIASHSTTRNA